MKQDRKTKQSAGLAMCRIKEGVLEVLLVHPGGPFWRGRQAGAWSIPKGEVAPGEDEVQAARREFIEETGFTVGDRLLPLGQIQQRSGKLVKAWAFCGDCDPQQLRSNTFAMEWPPGSGQQQSFPEVDQAGFFTVAEARRLINPGQIPLIERLREHFGEAYERSAAAPPRTSLEEPPKARGT